MAAQARDVVCKMLVKTHLYYGIRVTLRSMLRDTEAEALPQAKAREQAAQIAVLAVQVATACQKGASGGGGGGEAAAR